MKKIKKCIDQKTCIYIGKGENLDDDRICVREKLRLILNATQNPWNIAIHKIEVYLPLSILSNNTYIVELPGYNDTSPIQRMHYMKYLTQATHIIVVTLNNLVSDAQTIEQIRISKILQKV